MPISLQITVLENILSQGWLSYIETEDSLGRRIFEVSWNKNGKGHIICAPFYFKEMPESHRISPCQLRKVLPYFNKERYNRYNSMPDAERLEKIYYYFLKEVVNTGEAWCWASEVGGLNLDEALHIDTYHKVKDLLSSFEVTVKRVAQPNRYEVEVLLDEATLEIVNLLAEFEELQIQEVHGGGSRIYIR